MAARVLMVRHMADEVDDSAAEIMTGLGFELEHRRSDRDGMPATTDGYAAMIVYGGPHAVEDADYVRRELAFIERWLATGKPYLGFCLGAQLLARAIGAAVGPRADGLHEVGFREIRPTAAGRQLLAGPMHHYEYHYHGITGLPPEAEILAASEHYPVQAFRLGEARYGFQFHPETNAALFERSLQKQAASGAFARPGVDDAARQRADAAVHMAPMRLWLETFLTRWSAGFVPLPLSDDADA
jgi:GMP synthase (glutamine-hydrolysing)